MDKDQYKLIKKKNENSMDENQEKLIEKKNEKIEYYIEKQRWYVLFIFVM